MYRRFINSSAPNLVNICIDEVDAGFYHGRFFHKYQEKFQQFHDVRELLEIMEKLFDQCGYPQSTTRNRSFQEKKEKTVGEAALQVVDSDFVLSQKGALATFIVHVKHRQHSTWQGEVVWAEKSMKCTFRSALELLKLIDSALDGLTE